VGKAQWLRNGKWIFNKFNMTCDFYRCSTFLMQRLLFYQAAWCFDRIIKRAPQEKKKRLYTNTKQGIRGIL
jgi:hypothetical protein